MRMGPTSTSTWGAKPCGDGEAVHLVFSDTQDVDGLRVGDLVRLVPRLILKGNEDHIERHDEEERSPLVGHALRDGDDGDALERSDAGEVEVGEALEWMELEVQHRWKEGERRILRRRNPETHTRGKGPVDM